MCTRWRSWLWYCPKNRKVAGSIPTQERLAKIVSATRTNAHSAEPVDTLLHRLTDCNEGVDIWLRTRDRLANILRTDPKYVLPEWTIRPCFQFWPLQRYGAILWILAHMVYYRMQHRGRLTLGKYADFLLRTLWKNTRHAGGTTSGITRQYCELRPPLRLETQTPPCFGLACSLPGDSRVTYLLTSTPNNRAVPASPADEDTS
jgi:hypothetical protein